MILLIIAGIVLLVALYVIYLFNNIIGKANATDNAFGTIDAMLKKRYDLIPNLVETVKQYMIHESAVLTEVTKLRSRYTDQLTNEEKVDIHNEISKKLNGMMVSVENYPVLKANQNFLKLQAAWYETEEQISAARRYYNTTIMDYNNAILKFPGRLIARKYNYIPKKVFEIDEAQRLNISAKELFRA